MARLSYFDIVKGIKRVLEEDQDLQNHYVNGVRVRIADPIGPAIAEMAPCVIVTLKARAAPPDRQVISAGRITQFNIQIELVCCEYDLESIERSQERLDELISLTEIAVMKDRTLRGTVETFRLDGGRFDNINEGNHFISAAEINIFVHARTSY